MKSKLINLLLFIVFFLFAIFLPILYSIQGITDQFLFEHIGFTNLFLNSGNFPLEFQTFSPKNIPGTISNYFVICKVSNISPNSLQFIPIVGLILPIAFFALGSKLTSSKTLIAALTLCVMYKIPPSNFFMVWTHAWGFFLFIVLVHLTIRLYEKKDFTGVFLLLIVFVSIHFYSYTVEMWSIVFLLAFNFILFTEAYLTKNNSLTKKMLVNVNLVFITICFTFNKIIYDVYLVKGAYISTFVQSTDIFYSVIFNKNKPNLFEYSYIGESHPAQSFFGLLYYILLLSVIFVPLIKSSIQFLVSRDKSIIRSEAGIQNTLKIALILVGVADIAVYGMAGLLTTRALLFLFPIAALISLSQLKIKKLYKCTYLISLILVVLIHASMSIYYEPLPVDYTKYEYLEPSANWFIDNSIDLNVLTDLRTGNKYFLEGTSKSIVVKKNVITAEEYTSIINSNMASNKTRPLKEVSNYIVLNKNLKSVQSIDWGDYEPFTNHLERINENKDLSNIYSDGYVLIMKT